VRESDVAAGYPRGAMPSDAAENGRVRAWVSRGVPLVVTGAIVAALLAKYRLADILAQMRAGNAAAMAPLPIVVPFFYVFLQGLWDWIILRDTLATTARAPASAPASASPSSPPPLRYLDVVRARAATSVVMVVGYILGHGGFGVWLAKRAGARAGVVGGALLYAMASDLAAVSLVAGTAIVVGGADVPRQLAILAGSAALAQIALVVAMPRSATERFPVLAPWRRVRRGPGLLQILGRAASIVVMVTSAWTASRLFGLTIPFAAFATYMPVVLLVVALPVNVGGLGAAQAAWLLFLPWAEGPRILAFQFLWQLFMGLGIVGRGLPFLRRITREITDADPRNP